MKECAPHELPGGWVWTSLEEVCLYPQYGWTTSAKTEGALYLLRTTDITSGNIDWNTVPFCKEEPSETEKYLLNDGDIVISRAGSVGYSHLIKNPKKAIFASYLIRFRPLINEKYLAYFLKSPIYWNSISEKSLGIAIPNVNASKLKQISIPLPPLPEQRVIVSKIEQLFSDLASGIENFKKAQAQLKLYRQSVLKAACEGKLVPTEAELARAQGRTYEAADVLLEHIKEEQKISVKNKFNATQPIDISDLPELPEGWVWTNMEGPGKVSGGLTKNSKREATLQKMPYLRVANVYAGELLLDDIKDIGVDDKEIERVLLEAGDLLVVEGNGSIDQIGRAALWNGSISPCVHQNHIIKVRFNPIEIGKYVSLWLLSKNGRKQVTNVANSTSGLYTLNISKVSGLPIPLPPLAEQRRIVAEVERRLSVSDKMEEIISESLQIAESLRQSILKKAFEGRLLNKKELEKARNAPDWEPAEKLLERIRQEKQIKENNNKPATRKRKE